MAGSVVQEESRMAIRDDHVHGAVSIDVHEENSRVVVRRGEAEIRRLHGIEGLVRRHQAAGRGVLEKMRGAALDRGGPADGAGGAQLPTDLRGRIAGFSAKKGEIEDGQSRHALGIAPSRPTLQADLDA
jgi:hypothetical protein